MFSMLLRERCSGTYKFLTFFGRKHVEVFSHVVLTTATAAALLLPAVPVTMVLLMERVRTLFFLIVFEDGHGAIECVGSMLGGWEKESESGSESELLLAK